MKTKQLTSGLTKVQVNALRQAVFEYAAWRGSLVGNPDTSDLEAFDRNVAIAVSALRTLGIAPIRGTIYHG
jgi:hypothetical protein